MAPAICGTRVPGLILPGQRMWNGHADAAFVERALAALHAAVPAVSVGAVVGEVDDDGVVGEIRGRRGA